MIQQPNAAGTSRVLVFSSALDRRERLLAAVAASGRFSPASIVPGAGLAQANRPLAGLVDVGDGTILEGPAISQVRDALGGAPIIVTSGALSPERTRLLLKLGAVDWLQEPFSDADVVRAIDQLTLATRSAKVTTFIPASGGAGATTLALLAAGTLARQSKVSRNAVIDLDFQSANAAAYLNAASEFDVDSLLDKPERLDLELSELMKKTHPSGISLYSFERPSFYFHPRAKDLVLRLLDLAATKNDSLIIDLPNLRTTWFADVVRNSDRILVVAELNVPSLGRTRRLLAELVQIRGDRSGIEVVVNKAEFKLFGNVIARKDVDKMLEGIPLHTVAADPRLASDAINRGLMPYEIEPRARLVREAQALLEGPGKPESKRR